MHRQMLHNQYGSYTQNVRKNGESAITSPKAKPKLAVCASRYIIKENNVEYFHYM